MEVIFSGFLGITLFKTGEVTQGTLLLLQSVEDCRVLKDNMYFANFHLALALMYRDTQQYETSKEHFHKALEKSPATLLASIKYNLAPIYAKEGDLDKAYALLNEAEELGPFTTIEQCNFLCNKSQVLHHAGRSKRARQALKEAIAIQKKEKLSRLVDTGDLIRKSARLLK